MALGSTRSIKHSMLGEALGDEGCEPFDAASASLYSRSCSFAHQQKGIFPWKEVFVSCTLRTSAWSFSFVVACLLSSSCCARSLTTISSLWKSSFTGPAFEDVAIARRFPPVLRSLGLSALRSQGPLCACSLGSACGRCRGVRCFDRGWGPEL